MAASHILQDAGEKALGAAQGEGGIVEEGNGRASAAVNLRQVLYGQEELASLANKPWLHFPRFFPLVGSKIGSADSNEGNVVNDKPQSILQLVRRG